MGKWPEENAGRRWSEFIHVLIYCFLRYSSMLRMCGLHGSAIAQVR